MRRCGAQRRPDPDFAPSPRECKRHQAHTPPSRAATHHADDGKRLDKTPSSADRHHQSGPV
jgi:hypothetical protein